MRAGSHWIWIELRPNGGTAAGGFSMSFDIKSCQLMHFGPHKAIKGRITGVVRVRIGEDFLGTRTDYTLDLKVRSDIGQAHSEAIRHALLAHAARQLNKLKVRHEQRLPAAAE